MSADEPKINPHIEFMMTEMLDEFMAYPEYTDKRLELRKYDPDKEVIYNITLCFDNQAEKASVDVLMDKIMAFTNCMLLIGAMPETYLTAGQNVQKEKLMKYIGSMIDDITKRIELLTERQPQLSVQDKKESIYD